MPGSTSADRIISILNYFISYPKQSFTVAQIVKSLKVSRATCDAVLVSLANAGYLYRSSDKRYMLGPAFLAIAHRAQTTFDPIEVARMEIRQLADKLDAVIALHTREKDLVIPRERAASARHLSLSFPPDVRHALHPWGVLFLAGLDDQAIEESFETAKPPLGKAERQLERQLIAFARRHGFLFAVHPSEEVKQQKIRTGQMSMGDFITDLIATRKYKLLFIMAPVVGRDGQVMFEIAVSGFDRKYSGSEISQVAATILESCEQIGSFIRGHA